MSALTAMPFRWRLTVPVVAVPWILFVGYIDWLTGSEFAASVFYLPGIWLAAWFSGRWPGILMAALAAGVWLAAELAWGVQYSHPLIPYWNALVRLMIFTSFGLLTSEVKIRKHVEIALRRQKDLLASILDSLNDGVIVTDPSGHFLAFNPAAARWLPSPEHGMSLEAWLAATARDLSPHSEPQDLRWIKEALAGNLPPGTEIPLPVQGAGGTRRLAVTSLPLLGSDGGGSGTLLVLHDLTERRELDLRISQASEYERRRIGQDLHDGLCQHLVGVGFSASMLQGSLRRRGLAAETTTAGEIAAQIREASRQARDLARGLYPAGLEEGLEVALQTLATLTQGLSGVPCHVSVSGTVPDLSPDTTGHLYRIAQEALTNATRHADPSTLAILLECRDGRIHLVVEDDGCGIRQSIDRPDGRGIGLQIMRHRAHLIGGSLSIASAPGRTRVTCTMASSTPESFRLSP
jgi:PAS domain S-box-containing protein